MSRETRAAVLSLSLLATAALLRAADAPRPADRPNLPAPYTTKSSSLEVPFTVSSGKGDLEPAEVQVFISYDRGGNWHLYSRHRPDEGEFIFRARRDGEYWLATRTIDRRGTAHPAGPLEPQMRVVVDTAAPRLELNADSSATAGDVQINWKIADESLDPSSLKIECQIATGKGDLTWQPLEIPASGALGPHEPLSGQTTWKPQGAGRVVNVRAVVKDKAGNAATASRQVFLPRTAPKDQAVAGAPATPNPYAMTTPIPPAPQQMLPPVAANPPPAAAPERSVASAPAPAGTPWPVEAAEQPPRPQAAEYGPGRLASAGSAPSASMEQVPVPPPTPAAPQPAPTPTSREAENWLANERPRLTASKRFSLEYDVEAVAPDNLAEVELWGTNDGGRTWMKWGSDTDRTSPFDVEVGNESIYGFRIVIVTRNGLASRPPQAGDAADVWIQIDGTKPACRLVQAAYGQGERAGQLDIRWEAEDPHLGQRPVTLLFSDRPDGPFTTIAAGLANNGQYWWQFDPRTPRQIYLRIEVRDEAGNVGVHQLAEPISVEGLTPRGRIRGVTTPDAAGQGAFRAPLFR